MASSRLLFAALAAALLAVACDARPIAACVGLGGDAGTSDCTAGIGGAAGDAGHEAGDAGHEAGDAGQEGG